jgi:hypothetical protein
MASSTSNPSSAPEVRSAPIRLRRAVRFWIGGPTPMPHHGGFGGLPAPSGLVATFELEVEVIGECDPNDTGTIQTFFLMRAIAASRAWSATLPCPNTIEMTFAPCLAYHSARSGKSAV